MGDASEDRDDPRMATPQEVPRSARTARKVVGRSRFVGRGDDVVLHCLEYGEPATEADSGPTLLILPGITCPAATWEFVAEPLARDVPVVMWDARGRGLSDNPVEGFSMEDYASDVRLVLDELGLRRPAILGHSMGARIAAYFAARHPDRVGPLILADPPMMGPDRPYTTPISAYVEEIHRAQSGALSLDELRDAWPSWDEERILDRHEWLRTCDAHAVSESYASLGADDLLASWRRLAAPLLLVRGGDSPALTAADAAALRRANRAAELASVPGTGHMIPFEDLDGFLRVVRRFLRAAPDERTR
jgi:N-formylmaleamate deformylase